MGLVVCLIDGFAVETVVGLVEGSDVAFADGRALGLDDGFNLGFALGLGLDEWCPIILVVDLVDGFGLGKAICLIDGSVLGVFIG